ncbi:hypothetical protein BHM03_00059226, partial [Ensete ventricosum]
RRQQAVAEKADIDHRPPSPGTRKHLTPFPEVTGTEPYIPVTASIPTTSDRTATLSPCSALFFPLDSVPWRRGS